MQNTLYLHLVVSYLQRASQVPLTLKMVHNSDHEQYPLTEKMKKKVVFDVMNLLTVVKRAGKACGVRTRVCTAGEFGGKMLCPGG